jgi:WXG100 family type VII secretion target
MPNLNVSYQDMHNEAAALRSGQQEITTQLNALKTRISNLISSGFVTDSASGAFNQTYESFTHGATQTISALDGLANTLTQIANTLQETDAQLAQQIGGA